MCAAATWLALLAFLVSMLGAYWAVVEARDSARWRAMQDHPSTRRRPIPPEDRSDWGDEL